MADKKDPNDVNVGKHNVMNQIRSRDTYEHIVSVLEQELANSRKELDKYSSARFIKERMVIKKEIIATTSQIKFWNDYIAKHDANGDFKKGKDDK